MFLLKIRYGLAILSYLFAINAQAVCMQSNNTPEAITARIKPIGSVSVSGAAATPAKIADKPLGPNAGAERYKSTCAVCHASGVAGAPKFKDATEWKKRSDEAGGINGLLAIAIKGKGGMPPKGTCMQCSDAELKAAIEYMLP